MPDTLFVVLCKIQQNIWKLIFLAKSGYFSLSFNMGLYCQIKTCEGRSKNCSKIINFLHSVLLMYWHLLTYLAKWNLKKVIFWPFSLHPSDRPKSLGPLARRMINDYERTDECRVKTWKTGVTDSTETGILTRRLY